MAPALTNGVPGLEGVHTFVPPAFPSQSINDWMDPSTGNTRQWTDQTAYSWLEKITGLHDSPDADDPRVPLVYQKGELPLPRLPRGRTITYSGLIVGETLADMRAQIAALRACCNSALNNPTAWYVSVIYDSTYDPLGLEFKGWGVPVGFTCDDEQPAPSMLPSPFQREFDLTFRQSDGRWWCVTESQLCSVGSADTPIDDGSAGTLTMTGTADSEPVFVIYGSGSGESTIELSSAELSATLEIDLPTHLASGDTLTVDFGQRLITRTHSGATVDYTGYINWANSNWWNESDVVAALLIGDNTLTVTGDPWSCSALPAIW